MGSTAIGTGFDGNIIDKPILLSMPALRLFLPHRCPLFFSETSSFSSYIYIYTPRWKSESLVQPFGIESGCCIVLQFPLAFSKHCKAGSIISVQDFLSRCSRFVASQSDLPSHVSSNQDLVGLVLHCIQSIQSELWGNRWNKKHHIKHIWVSF